MARTFRSLQPTLSVRDFAELAKDVAESYANSDDNYSKTELASEFDLTVDTVSKFMDYAVEHYLVSDATVDDMEQKSIRNQRRHSPDKSAEGTIAHYKLLRKKRVEFAICELDDEKIKKISEEFANETEKTKGDIAIRYGLTKQIIDIVLKKAITKCICDDETFLKIKERSLSNAKPENYQKTMKFFEQLEERRDSNKKGKANFFA